MTCLKVVKKVMIRWLIGLKNSILKRKLKSLKDLIILKKIPSLVSPTMGSIPSVNL